MSFYRIYNYPLRVKCFRHIRFNRDRGSNKTALLSDKITDTASENAQSIIEKLEEIGKRDENLSRARRTIRDLILCNKFDYFCTFTFNDGKVDRYDFKACKKKITKLFDNYKSRYSPDFRYVIVPEFHKDGAVHFHGMIRGIREGDFTVPDYIWKRDKKTDVLLLVPNTKKYVDWSYYSEKLGFFSCSTIKKYERCAMYVSKYITKELMKLPLGQRVFMASKNLKRPELIFDEDEIPMFLQPDFQNDFVAVADDKSTCGLLPDWFGECCSDLLDDDSDDMTDTEYKKLLDDDRLTYEQLQILNYA